MSLTGRVHPDCLNVSNPYHECTETCLRKIAEGKGRKTKKKSENGGSFKGGEFKKKGAEDRRSSNPYADEHYMQRTEPRGEIKESGSILDVPILGRRKERSGPKPPQELDNVPGQGSALDDPIFGRRNQGSQPKPREEVDKERGQGVVYPSDSPSSPSKEIDELGNGSVLDDPIFGRRKPGSRPKRPEELGSVPGQSVSAPSKEKVKLGNGELKSYSPPFAEGKDPSFNKGQVPSSLLVPPSGIITMPEYPEDPPENGTDVNREWPGHGEDNETLHYSPGEVRNHTVNNAREGGTGSAFESRSFSFSGTVHAFEESDDDEVRSVNSDTSVSVGKYRVKGSFSSILQSIMEKYGDIAASCQLESVVMRSHYLECVCYVVQELKRTPIKQLTKPKFKEMFSMLKDVESSGMDIGWLRLMINESAEAIELVSQHRSFEVAKANCDRDIESTRKELESQTEVLTLKEKEVDDAKKKVDETLSHLRELELKSSTLSETVSNMKPRVENLPNKPLLDKVF